MCHKISKIIIYRRQPCFVSLAVRFFLMVHISVLNADKVALHKSKYPIISIFHLMMN